MQVINIKSTMVVLRNKNFGSRLDDIKPDAVKSVESLQDSGMMGVPGMLASTGRKVTDGIVNTLTGD